jgi:ElaB/YqjD/DUF883 family membrane-anchored ribosome-binding protein
MSDDVFRYAIVIGVGLAALAFLVQAGFVIALYTAIRKMQEKIYPLVDRAHPVIEKAGPAIDQAKAVLEQAGPAIDQARTFMAKAAPVVEKAGPVIAQVGPTLERAQTALTTANQVIGEMRPRLFEISAEAMRISRTTREQVERAGELLRDAGERARERLAQIDETVNSTVETVENAGGAMKRAVMKPVREANGLAAGISAAISALVRGRKSSVDSATQDEEMFI